MNTGDRTTVGVVVVSHSPAVARGTREMIRQMVGDTVAVVACGGNPEGELGTDVDLIRNGIEQVWRPAGVVVLVDLGGAEMNAEMAIEQLPPEYRDRVVVCDAPVVEGAVMAAAQSSIGGSLEEVRIAAENRALEDEQRGASGAS